MALNFSRLKQWLGYENINNTDLNAEFNNILNKAGADVLSGANSTNGSSPTTASMQATENPGGVGSEVLSTTTQEDIKQLRFQLNAIIGGAQWYVAPSTSIALLNTGISSLLSQAANRISSGRIDANSQPMFLTPDGTAAKVNLLAASTNFKCFINNLSITQAADLNLTGLQLAPSSNNTAAVNDATLAGTQATKIQGEYKSQITIGSVGSNITSLNGKYAAFKKGTEVFLAEVDTSNNRLKNCFRGFFFNSADTTLARASLTNADTLTLLKLTWVFYVNSASVGSLDLAYTNPTVSFVQPSSPSVGDYWLDLSVNQWKKYSGSSFAAANAVLVGICAQDTSGCIAARSFDFANPFSSLNTVELEYVDANTVRSQRESTQISVYGTVRYFEYGHVNFSMSTDLDSGETDAASTSYYLYITPGGAVKISSVAPHYRVPNLQGWYHPSKPYRCVGTINNDGSSNFTSTTLSYQLYATPFKAPFPTIQTFTSGTGTYTTPYGCTYIKVKAVGPGGGGGAVATNIGAGGSVATTFGTSLISAGLGAGGGTGGGVGGAGGTGSVSAPAVGFAFTGTQGGDGTANSGSTTISPSGYGGSSVFGGGAGSVVNDVGRNAATNSGSGGSGGAGTSNQNMAAGGGSGGYAEAFVFNPSATYPYVIGAGGAGGAAGTKAGGNGAAGIIIVEEFYV